MPRLTLNHDDGWTVEVSVTGADGGPGIRAGDVEAVPEGPATLHCREAWGDAHPGVEPTPDALAGALCAASDWLDEEAERLLRSWA